MRRHILALFFVVLTALQLTNTSPIQATTLIGNPYINGFQNWIDPAQDRLGDWRLNLHSNTVMETLDLIPGGSGTKPATTFRHSSSKTTTRRRPRTT